jgi:hypothetical protein
MRQFGTDAFLRAMLVLSLGLVPLTFGPSPAAEVTAKLDPCGLLSSAEVEAVLGEALVGPPFRANDGIPDAEGRSCRYEGSHFRAVDVSAEWTDGSRKLGLIDMMGSVVESGGLKGVLTLSNGTVVRGAWDEARDFLCCEFNAVLADQLVVVDISSSRATIDQAASLADKAVKRFEKPLATDGVAGLAAALEREKTRPPFVSACALVTRSEAEAIIGGVVTQTPEGNDTSCHFSWRASGADYDEELTLSVTWRGGLGEMRQAQAAIGQALAFLTAEGLATIQSQKSNEELFDERAESLIGLMAVRKDVLLSIETGGMNNDLASGLITAAAKKL